jgi:nucleotide-binding universal stress UspA family protein
MSTIVVGVDGSEDSVEALRFALDEAVRSHAAVKAVTAWHVPPAAYGVGWSVPVEPASFELAAKAQLEHTLDEAGVAAAGVDVEAAVVKGEAAEVLCDAARDAELLVVGSRGFGAVRSLVSGSVGQACVHHAPCPVVIVPHGTHDR